MQNVAEKGEVTHTQVKPLCPVFGECGGCRYQNIPYHEELQVKENIVKALYLENLDVEQGSFDPIVPSPKPYHYRNRLDLKLLRTKDCGILMGFSPENRFRVIPVESCPIALKEISDFLPQLKEEAITNLPSKYRIANLVVRCGDEGKVRWGGIGRGSLKLSSEEYFSTKIKGRKISYSLDTFFQANLSILPELIERICSLNIFNRNTVFYDLYGGVGFFGISFYDFLKKVVLIEEDVHSLEIARFNVRHHGLDSFEIIAGRVEKKLPALLEEEEENAGERVAFIDPPRAGIKDKTLMAELNPKEFKNVLYLSCNPETQVKDLNYFTDAGWRVDKVIPFDFFPKTKHIEVLTVLRPQ